MKHTLALILAAVAIGLLIVAGCRTQQHTAVTPPQAAAPATTTEKITIGPDEASCPVLGTVMKKSAMIPIQHAGKTYYLCCRDCVAQFKANPAKYITHPAPPTREMTHD